MVSRARQAGLRVSSKDIFLHQSIAALAPVVSATEDHQLAPVQGPAPLAPVQRWFFDTYGALGHFTMSTVLELAEDVEETALRTALEAVVARHDALRLRFECRAGQWQQQADPDVPDGVLVCHDLSGLTATRQQAAMVAAADAVRADLDPVAGRVIKAVFFGRMIPIFRSLISIPAGVERMPLGTFIELGPSAIVELTGLYHNLMRRWADI